MPKQKTNQEKKKMDLTHVFTLLAGLIIGLSPIALQYYLGKPKLEGKIITIAHGQKVFADGRSQQVIPHTVFAFISNKRNVPVPVVDYKLKFNYKNGKELELKPYYIKAENLHLEFDGFSMNLRFNENYLLNNLKKLIAPNDPLSGFLVFSGEEPKNAKMESASLVLLDGFGGEHILKTKVSDFSDPSLLQFIIDDLSISNP